MTTPDTPDATTEPATEPTVAPDPPEQHDDQPADDTPDDGGEDTRPRAARDAARYRTQLRETETERDRLATVVAGYQTTEVEALATDAGLAHGSDLLLVHGLDELRDDAGKVDPAKVTAAAEALLSERPHWRARPAAATRRPVEAMPRGGSDPDGGPGGADWSEVVRRAIG
ncbi:MAG: hypothetical protein L0I76_24930 [Pseudonocardia sp.]|nr:hypothetical protein [Pseudonocardia sp.]